MNTKFFFPVVAMMALVMSFTSCNKHEETEIVDPLAGNHVVEATIHAEVSGAFTKAIAIEVDYTNFDGQSETVLVNGSFDGTNTVFDRTIKTIVKDKETEAKVRFKANLGKAETYMAEKAPWAIKCNVVAKLDGRIIDRFDYDKIETNVKTIENPSENLNATDFLLFMN